MKRLVTFVLVLLVCLVVTGFYRGWFSLSSSRPETGDKVDVNLRLDRDKVQEDAEAVQRKSNELIGKGAETSVPPAPLAPGER